MEIMIRQICKVHGYIVVDDNLYLDNVFDYDSWEYFEGNLEGMDRILKAVSSLIKDEISVELFLDAYEEMKSSIRKSNLEGYYTKEGLKLAGLENLNEE